MQMLYNSDNFAVVQFDVPDPTLPRRQARRADAARRAAATRSSTSSRARRSSSKARWPKASRRACEALIETSPSTEEVDDYIDRFTSLMQQPVVLH